MTSPQSAIRGISSSIPKTAVPENVLNHLCKKNERVKAVAIKEQYEQNAIHHVTAFSVRIDDVDFELRLENNQRDVFQKG